MSAIGLFGEFLVNNQLAVDAFLLCLLVALIAIYLFRMLVIKPKKDAEISELIKKIEALESKLDSAGKVGTAGAAATAVVDAVPTAALADAVAETVSAAETEVVRENAIGQDEAEAVVTAEAGVAKTAEAAEVETAAETETAESGEAETEIDAASEDTVATAEVEAETAESGETEVAETAAEVEAEVEEPSFLDGKLEETLDLREFLVKNRADRDSFNIPGERFMSRTWGEDRHGNIYTEDMLKESIG